MLNDLYRKPKTERGAELIVIYKIESAFSGPFEKDISPGIGAF